MAFYNTAPPTPSTKNNITDIAVTYGIRDFLLNKNLLPTYPFISTAINGSPRIGEPVLDTSVNGNSNVIPFGLPLETEGLFRYTIAILPNQFKNDEPTAPSLINIDDITQTQGIFGGVDFPQGIQSYPTSSTEDVADYGLLGKTAYAGFRKTATLYNLYLDTTKQIDAADWVSLQPAGFTQQVTGYLDQYGSLNLGDSQGGIQATNIIGSLLNGQGLGLSSGGVVPNFDIRSSLAGRVLGATGVINDTKLGMIGGQQLALALANNAAFNVQQDILGGLNINDNVLSLIKGGRLPGFRPNYQITVPSSTGGKIADYAEKVLGFTIPRSYLKNAGSIFSSENQSGNIQRANSMLENTGKGQRKSLTANMFANINGTGDYDNPNPTPFRSGYAPGYAKGEEKPYLTPPNIYAFYDDKTKGTVLNLMVSLTGASNLIPTISYNRSNLIKKYGFTGPEENLDDFIAGQPNTIPTYDNRKISDIKFSWGSYLGDNVNSNADYADINGDKKSLLVKTQKLFNSKGMLNIVSVKGDMNKNSSQIETANYGGISKGSAVLSKDVYNNFYEAVGKSDKADNTYCRSWTTLDRYDQVTKMVRKTGLNKTVPYRFETTNSTLGEYGFPKITPYTNKVGDPKNYMFSIENLAWAENWNNLPLVERGSGDLVSQKKGRIMWFPPYNIQFNESSNVNWESTNFIGRGEPVYTYNNTERTGNLSFSIIVDHPSYINSFSKRSRGPDDNYVASFFAGCVGPNDDLSKKLTEILTPNELSSIEANKVIDTQSATITTDEIPSESFAIYYPNSTTGLTKIFTVGYENGLKNNSITPTDKIDIETSPQGEGFGINSYTGDAPYSIPENDNFNYGLNGWQNQLPVDNAYFSGFTDPGYIPALNTYLTNVCPSCVINIKSFVSPKGNVVYNLGLIKGRSKSVYDYFKTNLWRDKDETYKNARLKIIENKETKSETGCFDTADSDSAKCKEARRTEVTFTVDPNLKAIDSVQPAPVSNNSQQQLSPKIVNKLYNEGIYFEQLTNANKFVFDSFREKIKYFHPAFHSTTPEGLNSRLTFLQQCTRQGPTLESEDANNLAFGRPPICILRVGDFYNTKIVIDNLSIDYEPLVWDLNPEGIGVQPMIANVNLSFKFIGGSTLMGPINKLQNALSFNYYANSHVYDPRADYIATVEGKWGIISGATNLYNNKKYVYTDTTQANTNSAPSQTAVAANATNPNTPAVTQAPPPITPNANSGDDLSRIKLTIITNIPNGIKLVFTVDGDAVNNPLKSEQYFRAEITDTLNINIPIIADKIVTNEEVQAFNYTGDLSKLTSGRIYSVKATFGSTLTTKAFTYTP